MRYFTYAVTDTTTREIARDTSITAADRHANALTYVVSDDVQQVIVRDAQKNHGDVILTLSRKVGDNGPYWSNSNW